MARTAYWRKHLGTREDGASKQRRRSRLAPKWQFRQESRTISGILHVVVMCYPQSCVGPHLCHRSRTIHLKRRDLFDHSRPLRAPLYSTLSRHLQDHSQTQLPALARWQLIDNMPSLHVGRNLLTIAHHKSHQQLCRLHQYGHYRPSKVDRHQSPRSANGNFSNLGRWEQHCRQATCQ